MSLDATLLMPEWVLIQSFRYALHHRLQQMHQAGPLFLVDVPTVPELGRSR